MKPTWKMHGLMLACCAMAASALHAEDSPRKMSLATLEDKIRGGWAGQMIGVSYGGPVEFVYLQKTIDKEISWKPEQIHDSLDQDDLYVDMTFASVMDEHGLDATSEQYGEAFKNSKYKLWHANAAARLWLNRGLKPPLTGSPKYNIHANDIDFQIESDFIGLMCPGLPQESIKYCDRVGRVMNSGDGLYGGMFVCGMYSEAFFEKDPRKIVEAGLACMPEKSGYAAIIRDTLAASKKNDDWRETWREINIKWDKDDSCTDGALRPFNIDARLNGAYIAIGLLYGAGDFAKSMEIATRCGQDADCNPSNAAGIMGVMYGYKAIPDFWKSGIPKIENSKFNFTNYSFNEITRSTLERAKKAIQGVGGKVTESEVIIPHQKPVPPALEQWTMGKPEKLIQADDPAWKLTGDWKDERDGRTQQFRGKTSSTLGAEGSLEFTGTAIAIVGHCTQEGGRADVFIDGKKAGQIDAYIIPDTTENNYWHTYGLPNGKHTLKFVLVGEADSRSKGHRIHLDRAIIYGPAE